MNREELGSESAKKLDAADEREKQDPILQYFAYDHLPVHLQVISQPFGELADALVHMLPRNPERTVALRKLLESKDCAVRAYLYRETPQPAIAKLPEDAK